jgi:hypothetical protein
MFFHILATAFLLGLLVMLSVLNLICALYDCGIGEPPPFGSDPTNSTAAVVRDQRTEST